MFCQLNARTKTHISLKRKAFNYYHQSAIHVKSISNHLISNPNMAAKGPKKASEPSTVIPVASANNSLKINYIYVLLFGAAIKFLISSIFPNLLQFLDSSAEFSTPISSWRSLEEGIFLLKNNVDLYDGGVVYHPPLLLTAFTLLKDLVGDRDKQWKLISNMVFQLTDLLTNYQLLQINESFLIKNNVSDSNTRNFYLVLITLFYNFNPINFLSVLSNSSIAFTNFFITFALYSVIIHDNIPLASACLAISTYLSYNPVFLIVPFIGLAINFYKFSTPSVTYTPRSCVSSAVKAIIPFVSVLLSLLYTSFLINDSKWNFVSAVYGTNIFFTKIEPNIGLWWYFFIEIFEFFSKFFIGVFNIYNFIYILPLSIRFYNTKYSNLLVNNKYRIFPFVLCYGFVILTKPYPTLNDFGFLSQLLLLLASQNNFAILQFLRYPIVSILLIIHAMILSPIFYYLWIFSGSGNSNFFYAINLVYSLGVGSMLIDFIWSYLSLEYLFQKNSNKEVSFNSKTRLTQI